MAWPGENLLIRLVETIEKSGTGLLRPWQITRTSNAETAAHTNRLLAIAAAEAQVEKLKEISKSSPNSVLVLEGPKAAIEPTFDAERFEMQISTAQKVEYLRKEINIEKAVSYAEKILKEDTAPPPEKEVDMDWFVRWRESASGMSSESMQQLWGHVLAGELKAPGAFSYRTMDFLRNISQEEAHLIERLAAVTTESHQVIFGRTAKKLDLPREMKDGLPKSELTQLEQLGILAGVELMGYRDNRPPYKLPNGKHVHLFVICQTRGVLAYTDDPERTTDLSFYKLTKLGQSLMSLVQTPANEAYLKSLGELLAAAGFKVFIADILTSPGARSSENEVEISSSVADSVAGNPNV